MSKPITFDRVLGRLKETRLYWGLLAILLVGMFVSPIDSGGGNIFLSPSNLTDVLRQVSITGIVAVGMTLVILSGGIDLSVGSVMALGSTVTAMMLTQPGWHGGSYAAAIAVAAIVGLAFFVLATSITVRMKLSSALSQMVHWAAGLAGAVAGYFVFSTRLGQGLSMPEIIASAACLGLCVGAVNGFVIARGGLQPFVATLASMVTVLGGARLIAGQDQSVYPIYAGVNAPESFEALRQSVLGIPVPGLVFLLISGAFALLLARFTLGRRIYAIGGNEVAAYLAGVRVPRTKVIIYALCGMLASIAGVLYAAQYRQGKPDAGEGLELDAIAAVVIGGASLMGGRGFVFGTVMGVLILGLLTNILQLSNVDGNMQLVLKGVIIVAAVLIQGGGVVLGRR